MLMGSVFWFNKQKVVEKPWAAAFFAFFFFPVAFGLCVITCGPYLLDRAALVDAGTKVKAALQGNPPSLLPLTTLHALAASPRHPRVTRNDERIGDTDTPRLFVCPLTFGIMRQPAVTPHGTTYDYEAVASWTDAKGRYPAHESNQPLLRSDLAPNRALRGMIGEWVAARSTGLV